MVSRRHTQEQVVANPEEQVTHRRLHTDSKHPGSALPTPRGTEAPSLRQWARIAGIVGNRSEPPPSDPHEHKHSAFRETLLGRLDVVRVRGSCASDGAVAQDGEVAQGGELLYPLGFGCLGLPGGWVPVLDS